jgi:hypothetical protein
MAIQMELGKAFGAIDGYKTKGVAALVAVTALIGHYWGPISQGPIQIPQMAWTDVWEAWKWAATVYGFRDAMTKIGGPK